MQNFINQFMSNNINTYYNPYETTYSASFNQQNQPRNARTYDRSHDEFMNGRYETNQARTNDISQIAGFQYDNIVVMNNSITSSGLQYNLPINNIVNGSITGITVTNNGPYGNGIVYNDIINYPTFTAPSYSIRVEQPKPKILKIVDCPICRTENTIERLIKVVGQEETCAICYDKKVEIVLPDCGHLSMCNECYNQLPDKQNIDFDF